ncbi:UNVERIFIED_CONTAM: Peroxiredoxin-like protein [Trichonephila clavipes]
MSLHLGDTAPDFVQESSEGTIRFHEWLGDSWGVLLSHPADYTPVCTTELGLTAKLKDEFAKRNVKAIALSVDPVDSHHGWIRDINETQNTVVNFPIIADADRKVSELYDLIHPNASTTATVRSLFVIDPAKKIRLTITYPASTGRNFDEILRVIDSLQLTEYHKVATPGNWKDGEDVVIVPALQDPEEIARRFPKGHRAHRAGSRLGAGLRRAFHACTGHERRSRGCGIGRLDRHPESRRAIAIGPGRRRHGQRAAITHGVVVRRQDLDAGLVEAVLDVLPQPGVDVDLVARAVGVGVDLVADVEVAQRLLQHERRRRVQQALGAARGLDQQPVHIPPGHIVADRHGGVQDELLARRHGRVVGDRVAQHMAVGQRDLDVLDGAQAGDQQRMLDDIAGVLADAHVIADAEGAGIGQHHPGDDVRHRRRRPQRQQQAEEHRRPLERVRIRTRQVGEDQHPGEDDHEEAHDLVGRQRQIRIERAPLQLAAAELLEHRLHQADEGAHDHDGDDDHEQVGQEAHDAVGQVPQRIEHPADDRAGKSARAREKAQHQRREQVEDDQQPAQAQHADGAVERAGDAIGRQDLGLLDAQRQQLSPLRPAHADAQPLHRPAEPAQHHPEPGQRRQGIGTGTQQGIEAMLGVGAVQGLAQRAQVLSRQGLARHSGGLGIGHGDRHHQRVAVAHEQLVIQGIDTQRGSAEVTVIGEPLQALADQLGALLQRHGGGAALQRQDRQAIQANRQRGGLAGRRGFGPGSRGRHGRRGMRLPRIRRQRLLPGQAEREQECTENEDRKGMRAPADSHSSDSRWFPLG